MLLKALFENICSFTLFFKSITFSFMCKYTMWFTVFCRHKFERPKCWHTHVSFLQPCWYMYIPCQHTTLFQRIEQRRNVVFWLSLCCYVVFMLFLCRRCGIRRNSTRYVGFRVPCQPEYNVIGLKIGWNLVMVGRPLHSACQFNE